MLSFQDTHSSKENTLLGIAYSEYRGFFLQLHSLLINSKRHSFTYFWTNASKTSTKQRTNFDPKDHALKVGHCLHNLAAVFRSRYLSHAIKTVCKVEVTTYS